MKKSILIIGLAALIILGAAHYWGVSQVSSIQIANSGNTTHASITRTGTNGITLSEPLTVTGAADGWAKFATGALTGGHSITQADVSGLTTASSPNFANLNLTGGGGIYPSADSTGAIYINKANNSTHIVGVDTTNARVSIVGSGSYVAPKLPLYIQGTAGAPTGSGTTPTGLAAITSGTNGTSLYFGAYNSGDYGFWLQGSDCTSYGLSYMYPLILNPLGGSIGVATTTPKAPLHVVGDVSVTGGLYMGGSASAKGTLALDASRNGTLANLTVSGLPAFGVQAVSVTGDAQTITMTSGYCQLTPTANRTGLILANGTTTGQTLVLCNVAATYTVAMPAAANLILSAAGTWTASQYQKIALRWNGTAWVEEWRNNASFARALRSDYTGGANVGASEDDITSYSLPAATLATGYTLRIKAWGTLTGAPILRLYFGTTKLYDSTVASKTLRANWEIESTIIATASTTAQKATTHLMTSDGVGTSDSDVLRTAPAQNTANAITVKTTGEGTNNTFFVDAMTVELLPI